MQSFASSPAREESHWDAPLQRCGWADQDWENYCCTNTHLATALKHHWGQQNSTNAIFIFYLELWRLVGYQEETQYCHCLCLFTLLWSGPAPLPKPFLWLHWWFHILMCRQNTHSGNICKTSICTFMVKYKTSLFSFGYYSAEIH